MDSGTSELDVEIGDKGEAVDGFDWNYELSSWEYFLFGCLALGIILGWFTMCNFYNGGDGNRFWRAVAIMLESLRQTVGLVALAVTTLFLEFYLRILDHFHPVRSRPQDEIDNNANYNDLPAVPPVTWLTWFNSIFSTTNALHVCRFCQRLITFQAILAIGYALWPKNIANQVLLFFTISILPRLLFSLLIIMKQRNLNPSQRPTNPNRHTIQFVFVQLLGYTYRNPMIRLYTEVESVLALGMLWYLNLSNFSCLNKFVLNPNQCLLSTEIVLMISLYCLRVSLNVFQKQMVY